MNKKTIVLPLVTLLSLGMLGGCASDSAMVYNQGQVQQAQTVQLGIVTSVQHVTMKGDNNSLLTLGGAALGGIAGSQLGQGNRANAAGAIAGALLGGFGADAAQSSLSKKNGLEITVKLDSGRMISIVQAADVPMVTGQRVRVLSGGGADRVVPY